MPRIPTLQEGLVSTQALPKAQVTTQAPAGTFGGGPAAARATQEAIQLGNVAKQIITQEKKRADDIVTTKFYTDAMNLKNFIRSDPEAGYINKKGSEVATTDFIKDVQDSWEKGYKELQKDLKNQEQNAFGNRVIGQLGNSLMGNAQSYWATETRRYEKENNFNTLKALNSDYRATPNEESLERFKNVASGVLTNEKNAAGHGPDWVKNLFTENLSKAHVGAIVDMISISDSRGAANKYFEKHNQELTPDDRNKMRKLVDDSNLLGSSQALVDKAIALFPNDVRAGNKYIAENAKSSKERAMSENRYLKFVDINRRENNRIKSQNIDTYGQLARDAFARRTAFGPGEVGGGPAIVEDIIPPAVWDTFSNAEQNIMRKAFNGDFVEADKRTFDDMVVLAQTNTSKYLNMDFNDPKWYGIFSAEQRNSLEGHRVGILKDRKKALGAIKSRFSEKQIEQQEFAKVIGLEKVLDKANAPEVLRMGEAVDTEVIHQQLMGVQVGPDKYREIASDVAKRSNQQVVLRNKSLKRKAFFEGSLSPSLFAGPVPFAARRVFFNKLWPSTYNEKIFKVDQSEILSIEDIPPQQMTDINTNLRIKEKRARDAGSTRTIDKSDEVKINMYKVWLSSGGRHF